MSDRCALSIKYNDHGPFTEIGERAGLGYARSLTDFGYWPSCPTSGP